MDAPSKIARVYLFNRVERKNLCRGAMVKESRLKKLESVLHIGRDGQKMVHVVHTAGKTERMTEEEFNKIKDEHEYISVVVHDE